MSGTKFGMHKQKAQMKKIIRFFRRFWWVGTYTRVRLEPYQTEVGDRCLCCHAQKLGSMKGDPGYPLCEDRALCPCGPDMCLKLLPSF